MASVEEPVVVKKRGPGRPPKNALPIAKKFRVSTVPTVDDVKTPAPSPPTQKPLIRLPTSAVDHRAPPSPPRSAVIDLSEREYQSIAQSAVLRASLDRSRKRWTQDGIFARYWVKPTTGKNAKPPPEGNPEFRWMKEKGECRIRVEPHIFEVLLYVEEKPVPKPIPPPKQYIPPLNNGAYGQQQPYRSQNTQQQPYQHQSHPLQPFQPRLQHPVNQQTPVQRPIHAQARPQEPEQKKPDPVISMLAARAQADPQLKTLMKEVANGNASQEQLRVFQRHIDELTKIINKQKENEEEAARQTQARSNQHEGDTLSRTSTPVQNQISTPTQPAKPYQTPQPPPLMYPLQPAQAWTPPPVVSPAPKPVILGFKTPDATEDRFLFPQHSILESLSPNHTLASFIVTRKGREAVDNTASLDHFKEYWQSVTIMVEVPNGREALMQHIRDWIKPADEVRKHMEEIMARCIRAPETHLALRLPFKGSKDADLDDAARRSETPVVLEDRPKKKNVVYVKKAAMTTLTKDVGQADSAQTSTSAKHVSFKKTAEKLPPAIHPLVSSADPPAEAPDLGNNASGTVDADTAAKDANTTESGRPKRTIRKSVRISEG